MYPRNSFNTGIVGIDHVSYLLELKEQDEWYSFLKRTFPNCVSNWSLPHITLAYSETTIQGFQSIHWDTSEYYDLKEAEIITISNANKCYLDEITDPDGLHHLVIGFENYEDISALFYYYQSLGATWNSDRLGPYIPFIFIMKNIQAGSTNRRPIELDREWKFRVKRYSRFSEARP